MPLIAVRAAPTVMKDLAKQVIVCHRCRNPIAETDGEVIIQRARGRYSVFYADRAVLQCHQRFHNRGHMVTCGAFNEINLRALSCLTVPVLVE